MSTRAKPQKTKRAAAAKSSSSALSPSVLANRAGAARRHEKGREMHSVLNREKRSNRANVFTKKVADRFLELFAGGMNVHAAAEKAGTSHTTVYAHVEKDPEFAERYEAAKLKSYSKLEHHLHRMATERNVPGVPVAVFGLLRAYNPQRWRENIKVEHSGSLTYKTEPADLEEAEGRLSEFLRSREEARH